jgi:hypothetical protein
LEAESWQLKGNIFRKDSQEYLPLYEAKMLNLFDHRHASIVGAEDVGDLSGIPAQATSVEDHEDPCHFALPRYWVPQTDAEHALAQTGWSREFMLCTRDVARGTDIRTAIQAAIPAVGVGHKAPIILPLYAKDGEPGLLLSCLNAFVLDFVTRQKIGGASLSYFIIKQLPVLQSAIFAQPSSWSETPQLLRDWLRSRVLELIYTAWDLRAFAIDCGWTGPPFRWENGRRFLLRCELDAAFFHLYLPATAYGEWKPACIAEARVRDETQEELDELKHHFPTPRDAVGYILDTFPIVRRKDEKKHGEYQTKRTILEIYDAMQESIRTGASHQTLLDPPPGPPEIDLPEWKPAHAKPLNWPPHIHPPKGCEDA